jgi:hypothetical protein
LLKIKFKLELNFRLNLFQFFLKLNGALSINPTFKVKSIYFLKENLKTQDVWHSGPALNSPIVGRTIIWGIKVEIIINLFFSCLIIFPSFSFFTI